MIELKNVTKTFGFNSAALKDVSLQIAQGELVLITGPSGAGKTTLLRILLAAEKPDSGEVLLAGRPTTRLRRSAIPYLRRNIGVVFQDFKLLQTRSAYDNVAIALEIQGLPFKEVRCRTNASLAAVGLQQKSACKVSALSGGEQQRVAVARAVVGEPAILLADEPTGNLDPERSHDILDLLDQIATRGTTVVLATHDPMVVQNAASSKLIRLEAGRVVSVRPGVRATINPESTPKAQRDLGPQVLRPTLKPAEALS